jgi:hypothetical protein
MEFGVFQGASVGTRPWDGTESRRIRRDVEIGVAAERVGFDAFRAPEHAHRGDGGADGSGCPQALPETGGTGSPVHPLATS